MEICIHGVWGAVCDDGWDARDADVVCGQAGFYPFSKIHRGRDTSRNMILLFVPDVSLRALWDMQFSKDLCVSGCSMEAIHIKVTTCWNTLAGS